MTRGGMVRTMAALAFGMLLAACGGGDQAADGQLYSGKVEPDPEAQQVQISAVDYAFEELPPTVGAGRVSLIMRNEGDEPHFMFLFQLKQSVTIEEVLEAEQSGKNPENLIERQVGDSDVARPGQTVVLNANLEPGTYGMVCFIETEEGTPHALEGMVADFEAVEDGGGY